MRRVEQAFALGATMHAGQTRKSGEPYFNHPIAVADMLADLRADPDTIIAALLHDTVEDTPLTLEEIGAKFGAPVAELIDGLTKLSADELSPQLDEQAESLRKIFRLMQADVRIMVIKLYDRLHNMQTVEFLSEKRKIGLANETLEVYVRIADRLCMQDLRDELEALCLAVLEPQHYPQLSAARLESEQQGQRTILELRRYLQSAHPFFSKDVDVLFEHQTWKQLRTQIETEGRTVANNVSDVVAVFACPNVEKCYETLGVLHRAWPRVTLSFEDFINAPSINGYRGLHTTIILPSGTRVRCKIRTHDMHDYARRGVTTLCFTQKSGVLELLSWTKSISPLADSTEGKSDSFFESLKSEILGESIIVYGPGDESVQLPKGSTALDGMVQLFPDRALKLQTILVNGKEVPFSTPLTQAAALNATYADHNTVQRDWLQSVQTHVAAASIRDALVRQSEQKKTEVGKRLLQEAMTERKRGFLEEFDERQLKRRLELIGETSLQNVYIAIAEGRLEASEAYDAIFGTRSDSGTHLQKTLVRYTIDMSDLQAMDGVNHCHRKHGAALDSIRYVRTRNGEAQVVVRGRFTGEQLLAFTRELTLAGARRITCGKRSLQPLALVAMVIVLWGLDPVIANVLLHTGGISPADLTAMRFVMFFAASVLTYAGHKLFSRMAFKPLWPLQPSLVAAGVMLFLTALLSYTTLQHIPATQYIVFIIGGLGVAAAWRRIRSPQPSWPALVLLAMLLLSVGVLMATQGFTWNTVITAAGSSIGFALYSEFSRRYQQQEALIHARYPAFVLWLSIIAMILTLPLIAAAKPAFWLLSPRLLLLAAGFALVFTFLPYVLFFECMRKTDEKQLDRLLPLVFIITLVGELAATRSLLGLAAVPSMLVFLWAYVKTNER